MEKRATEQQLLTVSKGSRTSCNEGKHNRAWLLARRLSRVRVGRRAVRIPASEVERIIAEGTVPACRTMMSSTEFSSSELALRNWPHILLDDRLRIPSSKGLIRSAASGMETPNEN